MSGKTDWELIIQYLEKTHDLEDEGKLNEWVISDEKNKQALENIKHIWNTPGFDLPSPDVEKAWQKCREAAGIKQEKILQKPQFRVKERKTPVFQQLWSYKLLRIAAAILFIISFTYIATQYTKPTPLTEVIVPTAQKMILTLSDGTKVTLDAETVFQYPERFDSKEREVYLSGEGYFEVTPIPDEPFVVHADNAVITVMGTIFNVRSWKHAQQSKVTVAVIEGKVSLRPDTIQDPGANVIISGGQSSELVENKYPSAPEFIDTKKSISWLDREMYFQDVPLREVLDQLERWYGYKILFPDSSLINNQVTIYIENKALEENLQIIALMNNYQFKKIGRRYIFSRID